jgi:hypothetical protein
MQKIAEQREKILGLLYSAVLSDVMDSMGYMDQAMRPFVRPLDESSIMFGRARTGLYMNRFEIKADENPYGTEIAFMDDLRSRGGVGLRWPDGPHCALGRAADHGCARARRDGLRHRRPNPGHQAHPRGEVSSVSRWHRPA